jgi:shikimate dehydrogenase
MHEAAFRALGIDAAFVALAVPPASLAHAIAGLAAAPLLGASVTVPLKEAAARQCARLVAPADRIGAVNCLVFPGNGTAIGHNTDAGGFTDALEEAGIDARDRRALLLGAGGAARAVEAGLVDAGVADVRVVARHPDRVAWTRALPWTALEDAFSTADLVVDCTPAALDPESDREVTATLPVDALARDAAVCSLVYHRRPLLLERAAARGLVTLDGKGMLLHQGVRAFTLWLGRDAPVEAMRLAL